MKETKKTTNSQSNGKLGTTKNRHALSESTKKKFLHTLERAGLTNEIARKVINSENNTLATLIIDVIDIKQRQQQETEIPYRIEAEEAGMFF